MGTVPGRRIPAPRLPAPVARPRAPAPQSGGSPCPFGDSVTDSRRMSADTNNAKGATMGDKEHVWADGRSGQGHRLWVESPSSHPGRRRSRRHRGSASRPAGRPWRLRRRLGVGRRLRPDEICRDRDQHPHDRRRERSPCAQRSAARNEGGDRDRPGGHLSGPRAADREDAAEPDGGAVVLRADRVSGVPDHPAGRRRLLHAAQLVHRRPGRDAARLGLRRLYSGCHEKCRILRHGDRHGRPGLRCLRRSGPAFRLGHLLLPQGPVRGGGSPAGQDVGRVHGGRPGAAQRRRGRMQLHRRQ